MCDCKLLIALLALLLLAVALCRKEGFKGDYESADNPPPPRQLFNTISGLNAINSVWADVPVNASVYPTGKTESCCGRAA